MTNTDTHNLSGALLTNNKIGPKGFYERNLFEFQKLIKGCQNRSSEKGITASFIS